MGTCLYIVLATTNIIIILLAQACKISPVSPSPLIDGNDDEKNRKNKKNVSSASGTAYTDRERESAQGVHNPTRSCVRVSVCLSVGQSVCRSVDSLSAGMPVVV